MSGIISDVENSIVLRRVIVLVKNFGSDPGVCRKLVLKFKVSYRIVNVFLYDRYVLRNVEGFQVSQSFKVSLIFLFS